MKTEPVEIHDVEQPAKVIGNIDNPKGTPICIISEKNLINVLKALGTVSAGETARKFSKAIEEKSVKFDFTVLNLQDMLNEELEVIQFAIDCGDLLIGDDKAIKDFIGQK